MSTSLSKRRMTQKAKADVEESLDAIEDYKEDLAEMEAELARELEEIKDRWGEIANEISEIPVKPYKKDVLIDLFGVAWFPYHVVESGGEIIKVAGFSVE